MNKIVTTGKTYLAKSNLLSTGWTVKFNRFFSKEPDKPKDDSDTEPKKPNLQKGGMLHDKQQSIQEESFFHKESQEQLKALKKKVAEKEEETKSNK